jgi:SAM-dependent methyltransferase
VTALDIAPASLEITRQRAQANGVAAAVQATWMAAETLGFPDGAFDWVVGFGLLHHADPVTLGPELRRVLRSNGRVLFFEPLGTNPILEFARKYVPYRGKHHSLNEHPLRDEHIRAVGKGFRSTREREFYLFSMLSRVIGAETSFPWLWQLDEFLIRNFPVVRRWCRYVLLEYAT